MSVEHRRREKLFHIRLLTVSFENKGKGKKYDRIIGNLITFIAKIAVREDAEWACISLKAKSNIEQHYIDKYYFRRRGNLLSLEWPEIAKLIELYDD